MLLPPVDPEELPDAVPDEEPPEELPEDPLGAEPDELADAELDAAEPSLLPDAAALSDEAGLAASAAGAAPLESAALSPLADAFAASGLALAPPSRKSVTYQPEPLSWKPAAVTCFLKVGWPHSGHTVRGASDSFCSASFWKPQDSQR